MKTIQIKSMVVILLCLAGITSLSAQVYYVSPAGSSAWAECHDILTPCSPVTAMENAVAGNVVYFRGGQYELYFDSSKPVQFYWYRGILNPSNSGAPGNPITFMAYPNETPIMNGNTDTDRPNRARVFGNNSSKSYIVYDGFTLQADNGAKMGGMIIAGNGLGQGERVMGNVVKNMIFNGGTAIITITDNIEGLRLERTTGTLVKNTKMFSYRHENNWLNTAAIKMYFNNNAIFENMEISNSSGAIYLKIQTDNTIFRNNFFYDNHSALVGQVIPGRNADNITVYNNVIVNSTYIALGIIDIDGDPAQADGWSIYNNTIVNAGYGILGADGSWKIWNNIIVSENTSSSRRTYSMYEDNTLAESDHNQFGTSMWMITQVYGTPGNNAIYTTLADWQASGELEGGGNPGFNSLASDPEFINASGTLSELDDFRLAVSSPSKGTGRNGVDMGAFIDDVGVNTDTIFMDGFE